MVSIPGLSKPEYEKPDPSVQYECLESYYYFPLKLGAARGQVELGSHPLVKAQPKFWFRKGLTLQEIDTLRFERLQHEVPPAAPPKPARSQPLYREAPRVFVKSSGEVVAPFLDDET